MGRQVFSAEQFLSFKVQSEADFMSALIKRFAFYECGQRQRQTWHIHNTTVTTRCLFMMVDSSNSGKIELLL